MAIDVAIRELRNHTAQVIKRVMAGEEVHLTVRGRRIAVITPEPAATAGPNARLLALLAADSPTDTGWLDELAAQKRVDLDAERDPWA